MVSATGDANLDSMIEGTITEIESNALSVRRYACHSSPSLVKVNFPMATTIGEHAFYACYALESASFAKSTGTGIRAFSECEALMNVSFPAATNVDTFSFTACAALESIYFPEVLGIGASAFQACARLEVADFPKVNSISSTAFRVCALLKHLVLRHNGVVSLGNANAFTNCYKMNGTIHSSYNPNGEQGYVYVPRDYLTQYPTATNWSSLPLRYRALEDYTVDGTTIGALDIDKMNGTSG